MSATKSLYWSQCHWCKGKGQITRITHRESGREKVKKVRCDSCKGRGRFRNARG